MATSPSESVIPVATRSPPTRVRFCTRCDAPIYSDEKTCHYCGGAPRPRDALSGVVAVVMWVGLAAVLAMIGLAARVPATAPTTSSAHPSGPAPAGSSAPPTAPRP